MVSLNRRTLLAGAGLVGLASVAAWQLRDSSSDAGDAALPGNELGRVAGAGMRLRAFGATGLQVSEVGFGSWAIGGAGYGAVEKSASLNALARAEELGCNFVDTAAVYGESERVLGEFLAGRRSRWIVATKYSGQPQGMTAMLNEQLASLRTDAVDFYQIHWMPGAHEAALFEELSQLKAAGKARFIGVSLYTSKDIDGVLARPEIDGFQVAFNLLEPDPFLARRAAIAKQRKAIIVRSALREGFLAGKFKRDATFTDPNDQRSKWSREQIERTVDQVERFRFLEAEAGSMAVAAARYPLSFPEVSTVVMGTKSTSQADSNFGVAPGAGLSAAALERVRRVQIELGLGQRWPRLLRRFGLD